MLLPIRMRAKSAASESVVNLSFSKAAEAKGSDRYGGVKQQNQQHKQCAMKVRWKDVKNVKEEGSGGKSEKLYDNNKEKSNKSLKCKMCKKLT